MYTLYRILILFAKWRQNNVVGRKYCGTSQTEYMKIYFTVFEKFGKNIFEDILLLLKFNVCYKKIKVTEKTFSLSGPRHHWAAQDSPEFGTTQWPFEAERIHVILRPSSCRLTEGFCVAQGIKSARCHFKSSLTLQLWPRLALKWNNYLILSFVSLFCFYFHLSISASGLFVGSTWLSFCCSAMWRRLGRRCTGHAHFWFITWKSERHIVTVRGLIWITH